MAELLIEEQDVTLPTLSLALEGATMEHDATEQSLYVTEAGVFPFWIELHPQPRFILLRTYLEFTEGVSAAQRFEFCNDINLKLFVPSVAVQPVECEGQPLKHRLLATYPIYYRDGLLTSHFIRLCRAFAYGMEQIQNEFDPGHAVLHPLRQGSRA